MEFQHRVRIPLRDDVHLGATVYMAGDRSAAAPCIVAMTPYTSDHLHDRGVYFAKQGLPFVAVEVRERADSEGEFRPRIQAVHDGYDVVEWVARQPYCNGKVGMYGGSYGGYLQWVTAAQFPPHLATIVPTASPYTGLDVPEEYAGLQIPILTITGIYDEGQPGALEHYRQHMSKASPAARARHFLIIGPWDQRGTVLPSAEFRGLRLGPASVLDMCKLHFEWYTWTLSGGRRPEFLRNNVAYYMIGAEEWRYAATLDDITASHDPLYLRSNSNPTDVFWSGFLSEEPLAADERLDHYVYDPQDVSLAEVESTLGEETSVSDQRMIHASSGKRLVYHSAPLEEDLEISGFFKLVVWLSIDQPDAEFRAGIYEIDANGGSVELSVDSMRARYREGMRKPALIETREPLRYEFDGFAFTSRLVKKRHRLRLVFGPVNSSHDQKNYNKGGVVALDSIEDARPVTVRLLHDSAHPSALYVPIERVVSRS